MRASPESLNTLRILRWVYGLSIILLTIAGVVLASTIGPISDEEFAELFALVSFFVALTMVGIMRAVLLPAIARNVETPVQSLGIVGYAFTESAAIGGFIAAALTGDGWVMLPFGVLALAGWLIVNQFVAGLLAPQQDLDYPRL